MNKLKKKLDQSQLVDVWRMQHNNVRDYTFYSPVHATYSRIDFFLVEHRLLEAVIGAGIGNMTFSDHVPVSLQIKIGKCQTLGISWRLNEDLLQDKDTDKSIKEELDLLFKINVPGEITEATVWEAHKPYIGHLNDGGIGKKKRMIKEKIALSNEISELEQQHKTSGDGEVLARLHRKREEMRDLTEHETRKAYNLVKKERYINGNKPGKFLARALKKKKNVNYIEKIKTKSGKIRYKTSDIAKAFQEFYGELYAININNSQEANGEKKERKLNSF